MVSPVGLSDTPVFHKFEVSIEQRKKLNYLNPSKDNLIKSCLCARLKCGENFNFTVFNSYSK